MEFFNGAVRSRSGERKTTSARNWKKKCERAIADMGPSVGLVATRLQLTKQLLVIGRAEGDL